MKQCLIEDCDSKVIGRGYCRKHYHKLMKYGNPNAGRLNQKRLGECYMEGCSIEIHAKGLCEKHYTRLRRHDDPEVVNGKFENIE